MKKLTLAVMSVVYLNLMVCGPSQLVIQEVS